MGNRPPEATDPGSSAGSGAHPTGPSAPLDVARVPLQDSQVARYCPVRADLDHAPAVAHRRLPPSAFDQLRADAGLAHRAEVVAAIAAGPTTVEVVEPGAPAAVQAATVAAMAGDAQVIAGAWLPDDPVGRRTGRPDLLVRTEVADPAIPDGVSVAWVPVDVKRHGLTRQHHRGSARRSALHHVDPADADLVEGIRFRTRPLGDDALQLAHHWRLLEAADLVAPGQQPLGGIVDRTGVLWWIDLDEPRWETWWADRPVSTLERYDHAFAFRLEVIAHRRREEVAPGGARLVEPVWTTECTSCPWRGVCHEELDAVDHVSLLPGSTYARYLEHRARGVLTRTDVTRLHWPTAHVLHGDTPRDDPVDLAGVVAEAVGRSPTLPVRELTGPDRPIPLDRKLALARLQAAGFETVVDLSGLDPRTVAYSGADVGHLPSVIDQARAVTSGRPWRARGLDHLQVPRADVEVDVDMENVETGTYLWGTYTTLRGAAADGAGPGVAPGYRPFASWGPLTPEASATVFAEFWGWLADLRARCAAAGLTFAAYCYTSAEFHQMSQIINAAPDHPGLPTLDEVVAFTRSPEWVDIYAVVRTSIVTGHSLGLKKVAPLAGFAWRDDDPGGEQSMVWHRLATIDPDDAVRAEHRARLLAYNEDDVLATLAVRAWLERDDLPPIESWSPAL